MTDSIKENKLSFIIFALILLYAVWFGWRYFTIEKITETKYTLTDRAKLNGYYASELLLNELSNKNIDDDIATTQLDMDLLTLIDELPYFTTTEVDIDTDIDAETNTDESLLHPTLIINNIGSSLNDDKLTELTEWIEQGGHLITFTDSYSVSSDDWQKVDKQLQGLQDNNATTEQVKNDVKLQDLLTEVNKDSDNTLLNHLGIYRVHQAQTGEYEDIEDTSDYKALSTEIDKLGFPDSSQNHTDNNAPDKGNANNKNTPLKENVINNYQIREKILSLYESNNTKIFSVNSQGTEPLVISDSSRSILSNSTLNADVLLASLDNTEPAHSLYPINLEGVRRYLQQQLAQAKKLQNGANSSELNKKLEKRNQKHGDSVFTPAEQAKTIETLLKLPDEHLQNIFEVSDSLSDTLVDINLGKGRITVLDNVGIWSNPKALTLMHINHSNKDVLVENDILQTSLFATHEESNSNLYTNDHAKLLVMLTKSSNEIWLFPNVDIDSLPVILWKKSQLAVLGLVLLTLIWVWSLYNRFGKRQYIVNSNQADIFRYFRQIGRYGWEFDNARRLTKVTRKQAEYFAKKALFLKINESLTSNHIPKLNKILQERLIDKISKSITNNDSSHKLHNKINSSFDSQLADMLQSNQQQVEQLIQTEQLKEALLPTANDLNSLTAHVFTEYTQTLWLVKCLLK